MRFSGCLTGIAMAALLPVAGHAAPVTYSWTGTVTSSTGDPTQGATVPVSVTLDRDYPADTGTPDAKRQATYSGGRGTPSGASPVLAITINGADVQGLFDSVHIEKNLAGLSEIAIRSAMPQCCRSFGIVFSTTIKGVVKSLAIPKTMFPANFQSSVFAVTYTQDDAYQGTLK